MSQETWREIGDSTEREAARLKSLARSLDAIKKRVDGQIGAEDVRWVRRMQRVSRTLEVSGRLLIHFSPEPLSFGAGVLALWGHKQLQVAEIGHTVLHGAYDRLDDAPEFHAKGYRWDMPIDEHSWHIGHNLKHHQHTNIAGKDPDIHFGPVRLTEHTPFNWRHTTQLPFTLLVLFPNFGATMNWHFSGLNELYSGNQRGDLDVLPDRSWQSAVDAHKRAFRKYVPYYAYNYGLFPLLAGPFWWKVLLGNWAAETLRDVYTAATIYCGHVGEEVSRYPEGTRARGKGHWYAMQVEAAQNFEVSLPVSVLCGGLDLQIEHHLFPKLPPNRLRQIAPEVRRVCQAHDVSYRSGSWPRVLARVGKRIARLSVRGGTRTGAMLDAVL